MLAYSSDRKRFGPWLMLVALSACAPQVGSPPTSVAAPPPPPPPAPMLSSDWRDWPLTRGSWRYTASPPLSSARYGDEGSIQFLVQCNKTTRQVTIMRTGVTTELAIITSSRTVSLPAGRIDDHGVAMSGVILSANNGFLDEMIFSRGRIAVRSPGLAALALPAWAEPARVVEDCRN